MAQPQAKFIIRAQDKSGAAIKSARKNIRGLSKQLFSLKTTLATVGVGLISKSFIDAASASEQYRVRLRALLGSVNEGNRLFKEMSEFAGRVPFEFEQIMASATQLSGVMSGGVDEINRWMPLIADLAAVSGLSIQKTTEQVARMYASGAASADLFRERGILSMLGFQAGVSVSAEETRRTLMESWNKTNSQFKGASNELAKTWQGAISMVSDKWFLFRNEIMEGGLFDYLKSIVAVINDRLSKALKGSADLGKTVSLSIISFFESELLGGAAVIDLIEKPLIAIKTQLAGLWAGFRAMPGWAQEVGIVGALLGGTKAKILLITMLNAINQTKTQAEWFAAYTQGHISFSKWFTSGNDEAKAKLKELKAEMVQITSIPDKIFEPGSAQAKADVFIQEVRKVFAELNAQIAANDSGGGTGGGSGSGGGTESPELIKQREMLAKKLEQVREFLMSEAEVENMAYENRQFIVEENFQTLLIGETQRKEILQNLELKHQSKILAIEESTAKKKIQIDTMLAAQKMNVAKGITGNMAQLMSSASKKEFEIGKKFAMANALIKGYEAVTSSYAAGAKIGGPYLGAIYATTAAYATKIQLDNIRNAQFGGGGGISVGGGNVSTGSGFNGGAPNQPAIESQSKQPSGGVTTITLVGNSNAKFTGEQLDGLFDQMQDAIERGDRVLFSRNSRQALELA